MPDRERGVEVERVYGKNKEGQSVGQGWGARGCKIETREERGQPQQRWQTNKNKNECQIKYDYKNMRPKIKSKQRVCGRVCVASVSLDVPFRRGIVTMPGKPPAASRQGTGPRTHPWGGLATYS